MTDFPKVFETVDYPAMIDSAMRGVVQQCLEQAAEYGLPGNHHFFLSFDTNFPGVKISPELKKRFPDEMTIVLQHQFWDLELHDLYFSVKLSFNNVPEKLVIPYAAMTAFADPSVKFGLQFQSLSEEEMMLLEEDLSLSDDDVETSFEKEFTSNASNEDIKGGKQGSAQVISLDAFRKKK